MDSDSDVPVESAIRGTEVDGSSDDEPLMRASSAFHEL